MAETYMLPMKEIDGPEAFAQAFHVSHETLERLKLYADLLTLWQKSMNLVAPNTMPVMWHRHFADSAQLLPYVKDARVILDLGSGAGFPGLVLAILLSDSNHQTQSVTPLKVHLVESNAKKCAFLNEVARKTGLKASGFVEIHNRRIESFRKSAQDIKVDVITARALASLDQLIDLTSAFYTEDVSALFLKGREVQTEIETAQRKWHFSYETIPSLTDVDGAILRLRHVKSV